MNRKRFYLYPVLVLCLSACVSCRGQIPLFVEVAGENGTEAAIVVPVGASETITLAAKDLQKYLKVISGAQLPVITPDKIAKEHKSLIALGIPEIRDSLVAAAGEFAEGECAVKVLKYDERQTLAITGCDDAAVQYGVYALLDRYFGVRFFHPRRELIPLNENPIIGRGLYWREKPRFAFRGMEPQTRAAFSEFAKIFADPRHIKLAREYIDYLAKNRQNLLALALPDNVDIGRNEYSDYYREIFEYAHLRAVKILLRTVWDGWPLATAESERAGVVLPERLKILCGLGIDIIDIDFGTIDPRNPSSKPASERAAGVIELVQDFLEQNHPGIQLFYRMRGVNPKSPEGVGRTVSIDLCRDLTTRFMLPLKERKFTDSRLAYDAIRKASPQRQVIFSPATSSDSLCGLDLPLPNPLFIYLRSADTEILSMYPAVTGQVHKTFGMEWLYWLNDYAAMRYNLYPDGWNYRVVLREYAEVFGDELRPVVEKALLRLILVHRRMQSRMQLDEYLWFWALAFEEGITGPGGPLNVRPEFGAAVKSFVQETAQAAKHLDLIRDNVPEHAREWFGELADSVDLCAGNAKMVWIAIDVWDLARQKSIPSEAALRVREQSERMWEIYNRRVRAYRYSGEMYLAGEAAPLGGPGMYLDRLRRLLGEGPGGG